MLVENELKQYVAGCSYKVTYLAGRESVDVVEFQCRRALRNSALVNDRLRRMIS
jgi:hypothetical protein